MDDNKFSATIGSTAEVIPFRADHLGHESEQSSGLERALALSAIGFAVFPCRPREEIDPETGEVLAKAKTPLTPHGFKDACTDPKVIRSWWARWPHALVGLPTGRVNRIAVADLDMKDGKNWRVSAKRAGLILPITHTVMTRTGGEHRYYKYPAGVEKITSGSDLFQNLIGSKKTGIDIRGDGGYVIAWGDLTREIIADFEEWPTGVFTDAMRRDAEAGEASREDRKKEAPREKSAQSDDLERAKAALEFIPADDRDDWVKVGMALKAAFGEAARDAWDIWSRTSDKYDARDQEAKWRSFKRDGIGLGTLFDLAKRSGWRPSAPSWKEAESADTGAGEEGGQEAGENKCELPDGYRYRGGNIEYLVPPRGEKDGERWAFLCSAVEFTAVTRNPEGKGWGLSMRIMTADRTWNTLPVQQSMTTDQRAFFAALYDHGLVMPPHNNRRFLDLVSLAVGATRRRLCVVDHIGWHTRAADVFFVLPGQAFGAPDGEEIVFHHKWSEKPTYRTKGTLQSWQDGVARYAQGNPRLAFALSSALVGPLLRPLGEEGGGANFYGTSSEGKTTLLRAAASTWDGGGSSRGLCSWRTTDNALEAVAWGHHDTFLALDEIGLIKAESAANAAYSLANGQGKARLSSNAALRRPYEFRVFFLSTGEISLTDKIAENGGRAMAGQAVRVIDIPADAGKGHGVFERLHGLTARDLADTIMANSAQSYGLASREFLQRLTEDVDGAVRACRGYIRDFEEENCPNGADGQVQRVCHRFALIAAAGELAAAFDVLPWPQDEATQAAKSCFAAWLDKRGGTGSLETAQALSHIRSVIELHGSSRFQDWNGPKSPTGGFVSNQLGYINGGEFYFSPEVFRNEICKGRDLSVVYKALRSVGALVTDNEGNRGTKRVRLPQSNLLRRFVVINRAKLLGDVEAPEQDDAATKAKADAEAKAKRDDAWDSPLWGKDGESWV